MERRIALILLALAAALAGCSPVAQRPAPLGAGNASPAVLVTPIALPTVVGTGPGVAASGGAQSPVSTPSPDGSGTLAGWHLYTDPAAGYSLMLPPGVDIRAGQSKAGIYTARVQFQIPGVTGYQGMLIRVEPNPEGQGIEQILPRLYDLLNQTGTPAELLAQAESLTVAGLAAVRTSGATDDYAIVVPYGNRVYIMSPVHDMAVTAVDPQALKLFNEILQTFRISG